MRLNKKLLLSVSLPFLIVGCYWKDGCLVSLQQVNCFYENNFKTVQGFQKKESIGHTNIAQREKDLRECGVRNFFNGNLDLNTIYEGMDYQQVDQRSDHINNCMRVKGYKIYTRDECAQKGKSTGFCN